MLDEQIDVRAQRGGPRPITIEHFGSRFGIEQAARGEGLEMRSRRCFADADGGGDFARRPSAIRTTKNQKDVNLLDSVYAGVKEGAQ